MAGDVVEQFGPYVLGPLLGVGGMGQVYRAHDTRRDRDVALKLLPEAISVDEEYLARFRREQQIAARLNDPHIVPIHDFGEVDGRLFLDMRLVEGRDIGQILSEDGPLPAARAVHLVSQVADALDAAHADMLVHRDIKPSNILVTAKDFAYVADFGIARFLGTAGVPVTVTGTTVGTLAYMAPERFTQGPVDGRADIYALACVLHECLTGKPPFAGEDLAAFLYAHLAADPPRASQLAEGVPAALDDVIARGMAKDADDRYPTAGAFAAAAAAALLPAPATVVTPQAPAPVADDPAPAAEPVPAAEPAPPVDEPAPVAAGAVALVEPTPSGALPVVDKVPSSPLPVGGPVTGLRRVGMPTPRPAPADRPAEKSAAAVPAVSATGAGLPAVLRPVPTSLPQRRAGHRRYRAFLFTLVLIAFVAAGVVGGFGKVDGGVAAAMEAPGTPGDSPFMPSPGPDGSADPLIRNLSATVAGDAPGLYGGTKTDSCDSAQIASFLNTHPEQAAAWAGVLGIAPDGIDGFLATLTPVTLRSDTAVMNHGFRNGAATEIRSVLQAGTGVLVDPSGVPRVRCYCGNPLGLPAPDTQYSDAVTTIQPAARPVSDFVVVQSGTNEVVVRPAGSSGEKDRPADENETAKARTVAGPSTGNADGVGGTGGAGAPATDAASPAVVPPALPAIVPPAVPGTDLTAAPGTPTDAAVAPPAAEPTTAEDPAVVTKPDTKPATGPVGDTDTGRRDTVEEPVTSRIGTAPRRPDVERADAPLLDKEIDTGTTAGP